jgi:ABC-2 type transport system permease protein
VLWYKTWAESRSRFWMAVLVIAVASAFVLGWQDAHRVLYRGFPRSLYVIFALVFGMGGLVREREVGTAPFTMALPVSRRTLTLTRAATGLAELAALSVVPALVAVFASALLPRPYPIEEALLFALRWLVGGSALFALSFFASAVVSGEYTGFVAAFSTFFAQTVTTQFIRFAKPWTARYLFTVQEIMGGIRPATVVPVAVLLLVTAVLIAAAVLWTERDDF